MFQGIDVSEHQGTIDWDAVKASGIQYAIIRSSYGHFTEDSQFRRNVSECERVGLPYGLYHYSYVATDEQKIQEAQGFLNLCRSCHPLYPCYIDMEDADGWKAKHGVTDAMNIETCRYTCQVLEDSGFYAGIYANLDWFVNHLNSSVLDPFDKWLAQWGPKPTYNKPFGMWQYTSSGQVSGISGNVDRDKAYKDYPAIIKEAGLNQSGSESGSGENNGGNESNNRGIQVGDIVRPTRAVSYDGVKLASFVLERTYPVIQVDGNRVVLGNGLNTAFNSNDLQKVTTSGSTGTIEVGSIVKVNRGAKSYDGVSIAPFVYENQYPVIQVNGNRVVLGEIITAFQKNDLTVVGSGGSTTIQVGDIVRPTRAVSYDGVKLASFVLERTYPVIQVDGNRVVLGNGLNTAFNSNDLQKVSS